MQNIFDNADILSLHVPLTEETNHLVDNAYINKFKKLIYIINTSRGKCVKTIDLVKNLNSGKVIGACLDVLENETKSVELYYTLPKESVGTEIALEFEDQIIKKTIDDFHDPSLEGFNKDKIKRIESYTKDFKKINIGELSFKKGISRLKLKTTTLKGNKSIDFRLLILKNKNEKSS